MKRVVGALTSSWSINTFWNVNASIRQSVSQSVGGKRCGIDFDRRSKERNAAQFLLSCEEIEVFCDTSQK